jgi:hypothetical protein
MAFNVWRTIYPSKHFVPAASMAAAE